MTAHKPRDDRGGSRRPRDEQRRSEAAGSSPGRIDETVEQARPGGVRNEAHMEGSDPRRGDRPRISDPDVSTTVEGSRGENVRE